MNHHQNDTNSALNLSQAYQDKDQQESCNCLFLGRRGNVDLPQVGDGNKNHGHDRAKKPQTPQHDCEVGEWKDTEDLLASELNKLSIQERSKALDDVHCVGEELKEDPEMMREALLEFGKEIESEDDNRIYKLAVSQNKSYIEGEAFRLMFLRANLYDVRQSVRQMQSFLRYKAHYFGEDKVGHEITFDDLDPDAIEVLCAGRLHMQREKDRFGRYVIYFLNYVYEQPKTLESLAQWTYYFFLNCLLSLPGVQTRGAVGVYYDVAKRDTPGFGARDARLLELMKFGLTIPIRFSSSHVCLKNNGGSFAINRVMLGIMFSAAPKYNAVRTRVHYGSLMELQYRLQSFGIPMHSFPVDKDGKLVMAEVNVWLREHARRNQYTLPPIHIPSSPGGLVLQANGSSNHVPSLAALVPNYGPISPSNNDVLLGRGKGFQNFPGNVNFRTWMDSYRVDYENARRFKRQRLARDIMRECDSKGIRFLKKTADHKWVIVGGEEIEEKIKQTFRTKRKGSKAQR